MKSFLFPLKLRFHHVIFGATCYAGCAKVKKITKQNSFITKNKATTILNLSPPPLPKKSHKVGQTKCHCLHSVENSCLCCQNLLWELGSSKLRPPCIPTPTAGHGTARPAASWPERASLMCDAPVRRLHQVEQTNWRKCKNTASPKCNASLYKNYSCLETDTAISV